MIIEVYFILIDLAVSEEYEKELENSNKELTEANDKLLKEVNKVKEEYSKQQERSKDNKKELEYLEKQNEKIKKELEILKEEKIKLDKKSVILENENNDYLNKARELECWADELKNKLDAALEENIIVHAENDQFKQEMEEAFQRMQDELEETKHEIASKEKIINRLTMHRDFLLKTAYNAHDDINNNVLDASKLLSTSNSNKLLTPVNKNKKIPEKFMQSYSKSFLENNDATRNKAIDDPDMSKDDYILNNKATFIENDFKSFGKETFILNKLESICENDDKLLPLNSINDIPNARNDERKESIKISALHIEKYLNKRNSFIGNIDVEDDEDEEENNFIKQRIDLELKNILDNRRNFIINTLTQENFSFDICINNSDSKPKLATVGTNKSNKIVENIDAILSKIQERKEKVLKQKKVMQNKLEKIGIKIS